ncbi:MAG TPA: NAD(P)-dependent alcohol dehydrogenase [Candidatus Dormibacteraeota bacterium]|nr:NAD(P)-dependent alcohol dehydrogenase [Candidatus Dormibacteraeota bacterium]HEX2680186.1 NAD(P)-dependent alcohol dehydrogenase [Candidatus Dormibacteraeota bacterium]
MKAVACTGYGPPDVLKLVDVPRPQPRKNELCIRIVATAVTASDCIVRTMQPTSLTRVMARLALGVTAPRQPILGLVLAGEVDSVGPDVKTFKVRDSVFAFTGSRFGAYAEFACVPEDGFVAVQPANLTPEETAALPYGGLLALYILRRSGAKNGQRVLIYGASGAIGTAAVQVARHLGAQVTGVCSGANVELVKSLGAAAVVDYTREDFTKSSKRFDVILDAVGKRKSANAMRDCPQVLAAAGVVISVDDGLARPVRSDMFQLKELAESGAIRPVIDRTYRLEEIVDAHRYVDQGHKRGNVVVTVGHET